GYRIVFEPGAAVVHLSAVTGGTRALARSHYSNGSVFRELASYRRSFLHYRDNLYFLCKFFRGIERLHWIKDAYKTYVGISRWPWRLLAKNMLFIAAFVQAYYWSKTVSPPFFENAGSSRSV